MPCETDQKQICFGAGIASNIMHTASPNGLSRRILRIQRRPTASKKRVELIAREHDRLRILHVEKRAKQELNRVVDVERGSGRRVEFDISCIPSSPAMCRLIDELR